MISASCQIPRRTAIITLIEKRDKDKRDLSNWRPISLMNVDVKIGSKAIAKILENVLPNVIHYNQRVYVREGPFLTQSERLKMSWNSQNSQKGIILRGE